MRLPKKLTKEQRIALLKLLQKKKGVDSAQIRAEVDKILKGVYAIPLCVNKCGLMKKNAIKKR